MLDPPAGEAGRLAERLGSLKRCFALSRIISASLDLSEVLERIMSTSRQALAAETVSLLLVDDTPGPGQGQLVFTVAQGPASAQLQAGFRLEPGEGLADGWPQRLALIFPDPDPYLAIPLFVYDDPRFSTEMGNIRLPDSSQARRALNLPGGFCGGWAQGINHENGRPPFSTLADDA